MRKVAYIFILALMAFPAYAAAPLIQKAVPNAQISGTARYSYYIFDVYDATLYAPKGKWSLHEPFALSLKYLRTLDGQKIAKRSAEEMRAIGFSDEVTLASWYSQMVQIFPDVDKGTVLTGVYYPNNKTEFYKGKTLIGTVKDPRFGKWFFGIWLSKRTTEPDFRQALLGRQ